tara:strand:+ start:21553 stop:21816 length:264 start_codon:yes stop_codon:yes gene_type:complete
MTKIYIYCLFDTFDRFLGVYSSLKAVHRDALRYCNTGNSRVFMIQNNTANIPSLVLLRNTFKGTCDVEVEYRTDTASVRIFKTKIRE